MPDALAARCATAGKLGVLSCLRSKGRLRPRLQLKQDRPESNRLLAALAHRDDLSETEKQNNGWRRVQLAELLSVYSDPEIVVADRKYPNFGIYSFARGLFPKPPIDGLQSSASRLFRARSRLFIYSRLFAFEGAYGVVDDAFDGCFVSSEYPMFACSETKVIPDFLAAYFQAPRIWKKVAEGSVGLGDRRQRVQPTQLLKHELMLPPMTWQRKIADLRRAHEPASVLQIETAAKMDALLPAILDRAFKGEL